MKCVYLYETQYLKMTMTVNVDTSIIASETVTPRMIARRAEICPEGVGSKDIKTFVNIYIIYIIKQISKFQIYSIVWKLKVKKTIQKYGINFAQTFKIC